MVFDVLADALQYMRPHYPHEFDAVRWLDADDGLITPEIGAWCEERFGPDGILVERPAGYGQGRSIFDSVYVCDLNANWFMCYQNYYFKDARHALEYKMRWT